MLNISGTRLCRRQEWDIGYDYVLQLTRCLHTFLYICGFLKLPKPAIIFLIGIFPTIIRIPGSNQVSVGNDVIEIRIPTRHHQIELTTPRLLEVLFERLLVDLYIHPKCLPQQALEILQGVRSGSYAASYAMVRGDVLLQLGRNDEAADAFADASSLAAQGGEQINLATLEQKLQSLNPRPAREIAPAPEEITQPAVAEEQE